MKRILFSIAMAAGAAPVLAQQATPIVASIPDPSTISLIVMGAVALGIARRKAEKMTKS